MMFSTMVKYIIGDFFYVDIIQTLTGAYTSYFNNVLDRSMFRCVSYSKFLTRSFIFLSVLFFMLYRKIQDIQSNMHTIACYIL